MQHPTAKLITIHGSQAVILPTAFRFEGCTEIRIRCELITGDVVLSCRPLSTWQDFMAKRAELAGPELAGFMRERDQRSPQQRDPLEGWVEES